jgi:hypothetical protein
MTENITLRDLTTQLENKDGHNVTAFFSGKFEEERFKDLDAIRQLNQQDLAAGKTKVSLDCESEFYYNDIITISASDGSFMDKLKNGTQLYSDSLDLQTLTHTDPSDKVPAVRQPVDVRTLTNELEAGDGNALKAALNGKYQEERIGILDQVGTLNQADLAGHKTNVTLDISVAGIKLNAGEMSVVRQEAGAWSGAELYSEVLNLDGTRQVSANNVTATKGSGG